MMKTFCAGSIIKKILLKNKFHMDMNQDILKDDNQRISQDIFLSNSSNSFKKIYSIHLSAEKYMNSRRQFLWMDLTKRRLIFVKLHSYSDNMDNFFEDFYPNKIRPINRLSICDFKINLRYPKKIISINEILAIIINILIKAYRSFNLKKLVKLFASSFFKLLLFIKMFISNIFLIIVTVVSFYLLIKRRN